MKQNNIEEKFELLNRMHQYGGNKNNICICICEDYQREEIFKQFRDDNAAIVQFVSSDTKYNVFERQPKTVFFVDCKEDFIPRFNLIRQLTHTTIVFLINTKEQRQASFNNGDFHRYTTLDFTVK